MRSSDRRGGGAGRREGAALRPDHRRLAVAAEAARIIQDEGLLDFRSAKTKAAERLGLGRNAPLPDNAEIEQALAERTRIFHGDTQAQLLRELRQAALQLMSALGEFSPRLVGDVLSGHATAHSGVDLHLFSDTAEAVAAALDSLGSRHRTISRRHRMRAGEWAAFPGFRFTAQGCDVTVTVFPVKLRGHAPLCPVDGRPMARGSPRDVEGLLMAGHATEDPAQRLPTST